MFCADMGSFSRNVTWIEPTATDMEGSVTLSSDPKSGDMFFYNAGVPTLVTYTAIDEAGLTASCSFYITIRGLLIFIPLIMLTLPTQSLAQCQLFPWHCLQNQ